MDGFNYEITHQKTLYMIGGTMGVGKSSVSRELMSQLDYCVMLDGDWCWYSKQWIVNDSTKNMVMENIAFLLNQFIHEDSYKNIVFCWVMDRQSIWDDLISRLDLQNVELVKCALVCTPEQLERNILKDAAQNLRKKEQVQKAAERQDHYNSIDAALIDITGNTLQEAAAQIRALKKRK